MAQLPLVLVIMAPYYVTFGSCAIYMHYGV